MRKVAVDCMPIGCMINTQSRRVRVILLSNLAQDRMRTTTVLTKQAARGLNRVVLDAVARINDRCPATPVRGHVTAHFDGWALGSDAEVVEAILGVFFLALISLHDSAGDAWDPNSITMISAPTSCTLGNANLVAGAHRERQSDSAVYMRAVCACVCVCV